jgi:hypothetical protein
MLATNGFYLKKTTCLGDKLAKVHTTASSTATMPKHIVNGERSWSALLRCFLLAETIDGL